MINISISIFGPSRSLVLHVLERIHNDLYFGLK